MLAAILQQTLIITTFVMGMMMIIEYINVQTQGIWSNRLQKSPWLQIVIGALLGIIPGCLGTFTIVSLYVHRVVMFPALIATLIATSGDEAYLMFSLFPKTALWLTLILFVLAIVVGFIVQLTVKNKFIGLKKEINLPIHEHSSDCTYYHPKLIISNLKNMSFTRALLLAGVIAILVMLFSGVINGEHHLNMLMGNDIELVEHTDCDHEHHDHELCTETDLHHSDAHHHGGGYGHDHEGEADWIRISLIVIFSIILFIVTASKDHFLESHLWQHIIKKHLPKIFLWTFGVILAITILNQYVNVSDWISSNLYWVLLIAVLIGIIPESGPHFIFVILFAQGVLPFSILLASSIVQDGHGSLPLLAETPKGFVVSKVINIAVGLLVGFVGLLIGF